MFHAEATDGAARAGWFETPARAGSLPLVSCRWAPEGVVRLLSAADLDGLGAQVVLGEHLPPDAPARRGRGRRDGRAAPLYRLGRPLPH